jgi:hypothetical protein
LLRLGFVFKPWQTVPYVENPAIGRFEGDEFDPREWRPRVATAAFLRARPDDDFWAARRVAAFSDDMIRAAVREGKYSDPAAETLLTSVLIKRRQKIASAYLPDINPLVDLALSEDGRLSFRNAAVDAGVAGPPTGGYEAAWAQFDNATGQTKSIGPIARSEGTSMSAPGALPSGNDAFVQVLISALDSARPSWARPVEAYFVRKGSGWRLVGLARTP